MGYGLGNQNKLKLIKLINNINLIEFFYKNI